MDPLWIVFAFVSGFVVQRFGLPPMVGFLVAGFSLNIAGIEGGALLAIASEVGVTLLLFSIGLKLELHSLARPEVWAGASLHLLVTVAVLGGALFLVSLTTLPLLGGLDPGLCFFLAFALSFSSTVFAVKVIQERGDSESQHARNAIGILIMQDLFAVVFLAVAAGKVPSPWALSLLGLPLLRRPLRLLLERSGHGEMLVLLGLVVAWAAHTGFDALGIKGDLGTIAVGMLIAGHPKAGELAKALLSLKELFLVGFFLSIGLEGLPDLGILAVALALLLVVPLKAGLFFWLLTRFRLRRRPAFLTSLSLANYSEFGLIVGAIGLANGWIGPEWMVLLAVALSLSFIAAAPLNLAADRIHARLDEGLKRWETKELRPEDHRVDPGDARVVILGMGSVGIGAYDEFRSQHEDRVVGVDQDPAIVEANRAAGRRIIRGNATDPDFWARLESTKNVDLVLLATDKHKANLTIARQLKKIPHQALIAATCRFEDEAEELHALGVDAVFNLPLHAGAGFADRAWEDFQSWRDQSNDNGNTMRSIKRRG